MTKQNGVNVWQSGSRYRPAPEHLCPDPVPLPQTEVTHHADPLRPTADRCPCCGVEPARAAWSLYSVVLALAIEVEAHGTNITFHPATAGLPQNRLPLPLLPRDFKKMLTPIPCNTLVQIGPIDVQFGP